MLGSSWEMNDFRIDQVKVICEALETAMSSDSWSSTWRGMAQLKAYDHNKKAALQVSILSYHCIPASTKYSSFDYKYILSSGDALDMLGSTSTEHQMYTTIR